MQIVPVTPADTARRASLLRDTVVPRWVSRCGSECAESWNRYLAPVAGFRAAAD